jgi:hypothetical protein
MFRPLMGLVTPVVAFVCLHEGLRSFHEGAGLKLERRGSGATILVLTHGYLRAKIRGSRD